MENVGQTGRRTCCSPVTTLCRFHCGVVEVSALPSAVLLDLFVCTYPILFLLKCFVVHLKKQKGFYRAFNAVFGEIGRISTENVIGELLKSNIPVLLWPEKHAQLISRYIMWEFGSV